MTREHTRNLPVSRLVADTEAICYGTEQDQKLCHSVQWADNAPPYKNRGVEMANPRPSGRLFYHLALVPQIEDRIKSLLMMRDEVVWFDLLYSNLKRELQHSLDVIAFYERHPQQPYPIGQTEDETA